MQNNWILWTPLLEDSHSRKQFDGFVENQHMHLAHNPAITLWAFTLKKWKLTSTQTPVQPQIGNNPDVPQMFNQARG
jgi:hypothetical protein